MTIAAAYLTSEGVVLGTDSTTTVPTPAGVVQLFNHAQKVFELGPRDKSKLCAATWGLASLPDCSHRTLFARIAEAQHETVEQAAEALKASISKLFENQGGSPSHPLGYFIAGVDEGTHVPKCKVLQYLPNQGLQESDLTVGLASFKGDPSFFTRVFWGHDPAYTQMLFAELKKGLKSPPDDLQSAFEAAHLKSREAVALAGQRDIPIREAIDFVYTFLHITIKAMKFRFGPPTCGGPIEVGFVTTDRPFRWAVHKDFSSALVEQRGILQ